VCSAAGVAKERLKTVRRVVMAGGVVNKRIKTVGRVVVAGGVVPYRTSIFITG
jgi:hypothetical protein